jgi:hypothetical protein
VPNSTSKPKRNRRIDLSIWSNASDEEVGRMMNTIWNLVGQNQTGPQAIIRVRTAWAANAADIVAKGDHPLWKDIA